MGIWAALGPALIGAGSQLIGGAMADRGRRDQARRDAEQRRLDRETQERLAGNRGWQVADPVLTFGADEARRVYENRIGQGPYAQNVPRPTGGGASANQRQIADRARDLALGGLGAAGQAGTDYAANLLGGGAGPGAADLFRQAGDTASGLGSGTASGMYGQVFDRSMSGGGSPYTSAAADMYGQAFGTATGGSNEYLDPIFSLAQGMLGGGGGRAYGGGYGGGGGGSAGRQSLDPNRFDINLDDPRFTVDPTQFEIDAEGNLIDPSQALDSQGYISQMLGENAPVGAAASLAQIIADPFARSNPQLEDIVRLQQEDLNRAHEANIGQLKRQASDIGAYGGSDMQLAQAQMASDLGRNIERASTGLRFQDYNQRLADQMNALQMGTGMDTAAMAQAAAMEIAHRQDLTDREKANLTATIQRQLANQGTAAGLAQGNQGLAGQLAQANQQTGAGIYTTEAELNNRAAIAGAERGAASARAAQAAQAQREASALNALLGVAGLQNQSQLGRLDAMGGFAGGLGQLGLGQEGMDLQRLGLAGQLAQGQAGLEQAGLVGLLDAGGGLGNLELGTLGMVPGLEGMEMGQLGSAFGMAGDVARQNAVGAAQQQQWQRDRLLWDYEREANALNDLINQGLAIGSHVQSPTGVNPRMPGAAGAVPPQWRPPGLPIGMP